MRFLSVLLGILITAASVGSVSAQEKSTRDILNVRQKRQMDIFLGVSDIGVGGGMKFFYNAFNQDTKVGYGFMMTGVRGENEAQFYDPFYGGFRKVGKKFFTVMVPMNFTVKRRLFRTVMEPNLRPFIVAEIGPVWGIAFPGGLFRNFSKGKGQISAGGFIGFGIEFGDESRNTNGVSLGFRYIRFPEALGEKKDYPGIDLRLSFLRSF